MLFLQFNSLRPSDTIGRHRSGSTVPPVMTCFLRAPSHYLKQCWLIINKVQWHTRKPHIEVETKWPPFFQMTSSNAFSWMKMFEFRLRFHWNLFLKFQIYNTPALDQIMVWCCPGVKPLSETMMVRLQTDMCVTRPQCFEIRLKITHPKFHSNLPGVNALYLITQRRVNQPSVIPQTLGLTFASN